MPNSPHEPLPNSEDLRAYLRQALPTSRLSTASVDSAYEPLILLETNHIVAAFGLSNGDMQKSFEVLYNGFKVHYSEQREQWDLLDLAFVFCVQGSDPSLDSFCSHVETDVYFCRKFVVPFAPPLGQALARLPFLPLLAVDGQSFRPPSAQTFLQKCGVPAMLAKYLVVRGERSPEGIVDDCISGTFGEPRELTPSQNTPVAQVERRASAVRLESVAIKNFRAYRKPQMFKLGADVTVLYGPNGFGKTSFFDAVDFVITGDIGRLRSSGEAHFRKAAKHLDSKAEESVVSLSFSCNGAVRRIRRGVSNRKQALLDDHSTDRKTILAELTGGDITAADRVENFVSLFRATHLFSQEHQELAKNFREDCELSEQVVSRMLAFEDYASAVSKASKVQDIIRAAIKDSGWEITELSEQIGDEKAELERLGRNAHAHTGMGALDEAIDSLRRQIEEVGITVAPEVPDITMMRGWRATLEARRVDSERRIARLNNLAKDVATLEATFAELARARQELALKEKAFDDTDKTRAMAEQQFRSAVNRLAEINEKRTDVQARGEVLKWVRAAKVHYAEIVKRQRQVTEEMVQANRAVTKARDAETRASSNLRTHERSTEEANERLTTRRAELSSLRALNQSVAAWRFNRTRLTTVTEAEQDLVRSLEVLRAEGEDLAPRLATLIGEEERITRQIAEVDRGQSELKKLLSQLQGHVRNGTCPVCGVDHGSKAALRRRIEQHVTADAASGARRGLTDLQEKTRELAEQVAINKQAQDEASANLAKLKDQRAKLTEDTKGFEDAAVRLGIVIESANAIEELRARHDLVQQEVGDLILEAQRLGGNLETARTALADIRKVMATKVAEATEKEAVLTGLEEQAKRLRADPRLVHISLDIELKDLAKLERLNVQEATALEIEGANAQVAAVQSKLPFNALIQELSSLKTASSRLRNQVATLQKTVTEITARLEESKLPLESVLALIAEESRTQAHFLGLRDSAASIERAIDTATTAAALTSLHQKVNNKERAVTAAMQKREQHRPWLKYFEGLSGLVSAQQNEAIAHLTREYGPRTSVIQRRLRSVYGFDEVEIHSHHSTIRVRVKRRGEDLRPTDYFSQSQQQTLLLGLFLTACLSQTWSVLSPVFLDDPVTHFDDLNTYAFLDLIVGLLESDSEHRQFIISTCDEKFLQLARQKFRHLGERASFYSFKAIGADGPVLEGGSPRQSNVSEATIQV